MKKAINFIKYTAASVLAVSALTACVSDEPFELKGEGKIYLSTTLNSKLESRSVSEEIEQSCMVWISNAKGLVRRYNNMSEVPEGGIRLVSDNYIAEAWAGDSVPAAKDKIYFKGREEFTVKNGAQTQVTITCRVANSVVAVKYGAGVDDVLTDYTMTVGLANAKASLDFVGRTDERGFFMMNSRDKSLDWTLTGRRADGSTYTKSGQIKDCKPATLYTLQVDCNGEVEPVGGGYLTIEIDEAEIDTEEVLVKIPVAPTISGFNFDINEPVRGEKGAVGRKSLYIVGSAALDRIEIECPGIGSKLGISGDDFELFGMSDDVRAKVEAGGINYVYNYNTDEDISDIKINFEETFTNTLDNGEYPIKVTVTDVNGKTSQATLQIIISDAPVSTSGMTADMLAGIWATRATIYGEVVKDDAVPAFKYRKHGSQSWTDAAAEVNGKTFSATLTGLEPGTTYEYVAASTDFIGSDIKTFSTEAASQFPESGFENWSADGKIVIIGASASNKFWDSGNTASAPLVGVNPTQSSSEYKHSGNYSVQLRSQFAGAGILGAFAAGNMFVGEFIRTDGTNGVLGWGRSWQSRPTKLKGWVRYEPKAVTHEKADYADLKKGDLDKGIIYIALLDGSNMEKDDKTGKSYPMIVRTKAANRQLFDKNASNVIAYGEIIFNEATAGDGMIEFEIPLTYNRTNVKPTYIMCTASASIGGDYFVGGEGSTMWLDDFELIYE
ncbi:MAG: DUF4493 domain-containing protein [Bacteroidales bacterium]|nr:DUF4493 domain-containing protein [Bacteroidales bacterium]